MQEIDWVISVDDHLIEPPDLWTSAVPKERRAEVPHVVEVDNSSCWVFGNSRSIIAGTNAAAGRPRSEINPQPLRYESMRAGYYDRDARLQDLDSDGVWASLCFPTVPRFCGQLFHEEPNRELGWECLRIYNDWVLEEWGGKSGGRLLPMIVVPLWDPGIAAKEIGRCAAKGARAVAFSENPARLGLPSIHDRDRYWDPVFGAAEEAGLPLAIHFGSSSSLPVTSADAPMLVWGILAPVNSMQCLVDWLISGTLDRFPNLKIMLAEGGIGWIPYILERCDSYVQRHEWASEADYHWDFARSTTAARDVEGARKFDRLPSAIFRDHFYGCFIDDQFGAEIIDKIGEENVLIETDYPHSDGTFPGSRDKARTLLSGLPDSVVRKVTLENAQKLLRVDLPKEML